MTAILMQLANRVLVANALVESDRREIATALDRLARYDAAIPEEVRPIAERATTEPANGVSLNDMGPLLMNAATDRLTLLAIVAKQGAEIEELRAAIQYGRDAIQAAVDGENAARAALSAYERPMEHAELAEIEKRHAERQGIIERLNASRAFAEASRVDTQLHRDIGMLLSGLRRERADLLLAEEEPTRVGNAPLVLERMRDRLMAHHGETTEQAALRIMLESEQRRQAIRPLQDGLESERAMNAKLTEELSQAHERIADLEQGIAAYRKRANTFAETANHPTNELDDADAWEAEHYEGAEPVTPLAELRAENERLKQANDEIVERLAQAERDKTIAVAQARITEFDLIRRQRPIDPAYWDMHHWRDLIEQLKKIETRAPPQSEATAAAKPRGGGAEKAEGA